MKVRETDLAGVVVIEPERYPDDRGYFMEVWHRQRYREAGLPAAFVQDNISSSRRHVLRGLHYQHPSAQGKLVSVLEGRVFDVAVDIRQGSSSFGTWVGEELSAETGRQLYVPEGHAHGFVVLSERAVVHYKCTTFYAPDCEHSLRWDDPALAIAWPVAEPVLSEKDATAPTLDTVGEEMLPRVERET